MRFPGVFGCFRWRLGGVWAGPTSELSFYYQLAAFRQEAMHERWLQEARRSACLKDVRRSKKNEEKHRKTMETCWKSLEIHEKMMKKT